MGLHISMKLCIFRPFCFMSDKAKAPLPSHDKYPILSSSLECCTVCPDSPPIKFEDRDDDKEPLTVYGMNGSSQVLF